MQINCIAIEDEPPAMKKLVGFIQKIEYLQLSQTFINCIEAIGYLKEHAIDLIFLDIQMEDLTGIQFLQSITHRPEIIITTAYDQYAIKGYEFEVTDYLLKPFTFERFISAVEKVYNKKMAKNGISGSSHIFIKTEYRLERIDLNDILYIEGKGEYMQIVTREKKIMTLQTFKNLSEILPAKKFIRVHKSYMVAIDKIQIIERNRIKINDKIIPVSETYKDEFYQKINNI